MGREVVLFKSEEPKKRAEAGQFLHQLADRIEQGEVTLKQGDQDLQLAIPESVVMEIKVEEEEKGDGKKYSLEVEIEWGEGQSQEGVSLG